MTTQHAAFDATEQDILSKIVPEGGAEAGAEGEGAASAAAPPAAAPEEAPAAAPVAASTAAPATADAAASAPAEPPAEQPRQGEPRAALRAARRSEARLRTENESLREEIERLRKQVPAPAPIVTDEELAEIEDLSPAIAKVARAQRELVDKAAAPAPAPAPAAAAEFEPPQYAPEVQDVIDSVPDLSAWQYDPASQDRFARAIEYDASLAANPDWKAKPLADRFAEAVRLTNAAFQPAAAATPPAAPAAPRPSAADVIAAVPTEGPKGISDFRGGAPAETPARDYSRMSDEEIMASLPSS